MAETLTHCASVTVSMGEERKGVFKTIFRVTRDSKETTEACEVSVALLPPRRDRTDLEVDVSWKHQEVVVRQTTVVPRVHELGKRQAIPPGVLVQISHGISWRQETSCCVWPRRSIAVRRRSAVCVTVSHVGHFADRSGCDICEWAPSRVAEVMEWLTQSRVER
jgi:hypothetical protein